MARRRICLPRQWPEHVKSGILHAISLAGVVLSYAADKIGLAVSYVEGRRHLPIIDLRRAV